MIERLDMDDNYSENEAAIHLNRYLISKEFVKNKRVLDVACGEGYGSYLISQWEADSVVGVDISDEAIEKAKKNFKRDNIDYFVQDATNMQKLKDNDFDVVVSYETFEHVSDVELFLKEIKRVAKPDATIIISCPNDYYYYPEEDKSNPFHTRKFSFDDFKKITENNLGTHVKYMIGMEISGYINTVLGQEKSTKNKNIINAFYKIECNKINNEKIITPKVCNYYVGIWNASKHIESCCVIPHMYTDWKETIDLLKNDNQSLKNYIKDLESTRKIFENDNQSLKNYIKDLESTHKIFENDIKELKNGNDELKAINDDLLSKNKKMERETEKCLQTNSIIMYQKEEVSKYARELYEELERIKKENSQLSQEVFDLKDKNETLKMQMGYITNSRSYKLTRKVVKLVKRK